MRSCPWRSARWDLVFLDDDAGHRRPTARREIRRALPAAGIFAITGTAAPAAWYQSDEQLDGLDERVPRSTTRVRGLLYANLLRPLVVFDGMIAHAGRFLGPVADLPVCLAALTCALIDRAACLYRNARHGNRAVWGGNIHEIPGA